MLIVKFISFSCTWLDIIKFVDPIMCYTISVIISNAIHDTFQTGEILSKVKMKSSQNVSV